MGTVVTDEGSRRLLKALQYGLCEICGGAREVEKGFHGWPALKDRDGEAYVRLVCCDPNCGV